MNSGCPGLQNKSFYMFLDVLGMFLEDFLCLRPFDGRRHAAPALHGLCDRGERLRTRQRGGLGLRSADVLQVSHRYSDFETLHKARSGWN